MIRDGTYILYPEGSDWIAARFRNGKMCTMMPGHMKDGHDRARDNWAGFDPDGPKDGDLPEEAEHDRIVLAVMGEDTFPDMVLVERLANDGDLNRFSI
ncbi:MAG: hypothetical protein P4L84_17995 [Isosphaeraceae bacterium]|nr:hypothetical protein [Isosphaeraceae bacterium]